MPRSPFQGTFNSGVRPTVVTAPDAMVYINGETDVIGCPSCQRRFDFNRYITSIQVDLSVESVPGSASISMSVPRHTIDDVFFDGEPVIVPMMEIEIYAKGHFLLEGVPQYYPIFWGLVTEVSDDYSSGEHTLTIQCADILKWWELCKININPAYTGAQGMLGKNLCGNVLFGMNPYDIIWTLAQAAMGDVVVGSGSLVSMYKEAGQKATFTAALGDMARYWQSRFARIKSNLLLYGTTGIAVRGGSLDIATKTATGNFKELASQAVRNAQGGEGHGQPGFDPTDPGVVAFRTQGTQAGQINLWTSEFQTKLEIANAAKEAIGFEFYMDVTGDIVFKPPFYNLDILANKPVSWIQDIDIIDWNLSHSEAEVVTQIVIQGNFTGNTDWGVGEELTPFTSVTDYHLLRQYGWRSHSMTSEFLGDNQMMFYVAMDMLDRMNAKRHRASVTIPFRPELRLGFPVYLAPKDKIWYISGISHNIAFGGRAQTTLTLTAKRGKFIAPKGTGKLTLVSPKFAPGTQPPESRVLQKTATFNISTQNAAEMPGTDASYDDKSRTQDDPYQPMVLRHPKTGRILGYPNAVMVYSRPMPPDRAARTPGTKSQANAAKLVAQDYTKAVPANKAAADAAMSKALVDQARDELRAKHLTNRYQYGLNSAGVYVYAHDTSKVVQELLLMPVSKLIADKAVVGGSKSATGMIRPVSDDRGFEVIGHYRYGRGVSLRDGSLVLNDGKNNSATQVGVQLALSGGLFETLNAQSQGLTSIVSAYPNPADAVARLSPDGTDLQTAAIDAPDMKSPEYISTGTNFVDVAPLGSPEQKGYVGANAVGPQVEASQFSRALTLAEMTIVDGSVATDENCPCLLGRQDLAFINIGYQVKVFNPASPDTTSLFSQPTPAADGPPVRQADLAKTHGELSTRVDSFLYDLYSRLDTPHQQYEGYLRGNNSGDTRDKEQLYFGEPGVQMGEFEPPFSVPNRGAAGDSEALLSSIESNISTLKTTWSDFGDKLKANTKRAKLQQEILFDQKNLADLAAQRQKLVTALTNGETIHGVDAGAELTSLDEKISKLQQDLSDKQKELQDLNAKFPP